MSQHAQLTLREIHGPYLQLLTNLQGEEGHEWLEALKRLNRKENPWPTYKFPIWKTIELGKYRTHRGLIDALKDVGCWLHPNNEKLIDRIHLVPLVRRVRLVKLSLRELGVDLIPRKGSGGREDAGVYYKDICAKALSLGLDLCPQETGPYLRLQWTDQHLNFGVGDPRDETVTVASEGFAGNIFHLSNYRNSPMHPYQYLNISGRNGNPKAYYRSLDDAFIFVAR